MSGDDQKNPAISLVIPAYNEETYLPHLLDTVDIARQRCRGGPGAVEVIVADNRSTDRTAALAASRGCLVVQEEKRVIGAVRNRGASKASGDILAFIDADSRIHPETFNGINDSMATGKVVAGATGVRVERMSAGIAAAHAILIPMVWVTGMDTGVVFCRRDDFVRIGGYSSEMLFAEDVRFLLDMRGLGRRDGRRLARLRKYKALASARKFDSHGDWHYVAMIFKFGWWKLFSRTRRMNRFARDYWYCDQRR
jgi:glycosyltransferase involved in cell wall biosynthesis